MTTNRRILALISLISLFSAACSSRDLGQHGNAAERTEAPNAAREDGGVPPASASQTEGAGLVKTERGFRLTTERYVVNPGEERYVCYVVPVPEDIVIGSITSPDSNWVHHFLLVEPTVPEREGSRECDVILELTWAPIYAATHSHSGLDMPAGTARTVKKGSQLLLQVHLSNPSPEVVFPSATVDVETSKDENPTPVGITLFGSTNIHLEPGEREVVTNTCKIEQRLDLYAVLPHMHQAGTGLALATAMPGDPFETFYTRAPFSFDDQYFDSIDTSLPPGSLIRISCSYDNRTAKKVAFGESNRDEMCFAIGFTVGGPSFQFCSAYKPPLGSTAPRDPDAGACTFADSGVGQHCTRAGGECGSDLFCTADFFHADEGICFSLGCQKNADCGSGNTCCTLPVLGDIANLCVPEACRPEYCMPASREAG